MSFQRFLEKEQPLGLFPQEDYVCQRERHGREAKKLSLKIIIELDHPDVILIQETMGPYEVFIFESRKLFAGWEFYGLDVTSFSRGVITSFNLNVSLINVFIVCSGLYIED